jgi:hypothetical protein
MTIRDGDWTLFDWDAKTGRSVWSYFDGEKTVFRTDYPVDNLISENAAVRNSAAQAWTGDYHRVASVPLNVFHQSGLAEAQAQGDERFVSRFLNDGDNRAWRTREGRV